MSVLINEIPIVKWKHADNIFTQITSGIKYNDPSTITNKDAYFRALPLKIYRKEIVTDTAVANPRTSGRIFDFDRPGGTITSSTAECIGITNTQIVYNSVDKSCDVNNNKICKSFLSAEDNARRRVRSSGMIRKQYNSDTSAPTYFTDNKQYLASRSLSYNSNSNFHVYSGDTTVNAGSAGASQNIYTSSSGYNCAKETLFVGGSFRYLWVDDISYNVIVPPGKYDVVDLNRILQTAMENNFHYLIESPTERKLFLISLKYSQETGKIAVESLGVNQSTVTAFTAPISDGVLSSWYADPYIPNTGSKNVKLIFDNTRGTNSELYTKMGITTTLANYPSTTTGSIGISSILLSAPTKFNTKRKAVYYKPSNPGFSTQGAVSSSDLITRRKYNTINTVAGSMRSAYGNQTASAVAYGVPSYGYTVKDKVGYPMKKTPTFSKYSDIMKTCNIRKFANAI